MQPLATVALSLWLLVGGPDHADDATALVLWVSGPAGIEVESFEPWEPLRPIEVAQRLLPAEVVELDQGATLQLFTREQVLFTVRGPGRFRVTDQELLPLEGAAEPERLRLDRDVATELPIAGAADPGVTSGAPPPSPLVVVSPRGTCIATDRPELRWQWPGDPTRFELTLEARGDDGALSPVERWTNLSGPTHQPWKPLEPGRWYRLTVSTPSIGGRAAASASTWFHVLASERRASIARLREAIESLRKLQASDAPALVVLEAHALESRGMLQQARALWDLLAQRHPDRQAVRSQAARLARLEVAPPRPPLTLPLPFGGMLEL